MFKAFAGKRLSLLGVSSLVLVACSGCDRGPAMSRAAGKVLYTDGSVPKGGLCLVRFEPTADSSAPIRKGATCDIGADGSFELFTRVPGDGVYDGDYDVTFAVKKSPMDRTSYIPQKYTAASTTPHKVKVDGDKDDYLFEIEPLPGAPK